MLKMGAGVGVGMSVFVIDYWFVGWVLYRILIIMFHSIPSFDLSFFPPEGFSEVIYYMGGWSSGSKPIQFSPREHPTPNLLLVNSVSQFRSAGNHFCGIRVLCGGKLR